MQLVFDGCSFLFGKKTENSNGLFLFHYVALRFSLLSCERNQSKREVSVCVKAKVLSFRYISSLLLKLHCCNPLPMEFIKPIECSLEQNTFYLCSNQILDFIESLLEMLTYFPVQEPSWEMDLIHSSYHTENNRFWKNTKLPYIDFHKCKVVILKSLFINYHRLAFLSKGE